MDGGSWASSWENLGGNFKSELAAVSWGPGRIDIFAIGVDDAMWTRSYSGGSWAAWTSLSGKFTSPPTVVSWAPERLDVFGLDSKGAAVQKYYSNGAWSTSWGNLEGVLYSALSAKTSYFFGTKRIDIFALGGANKIYQKTYNGVTKKWEGWTSHGTSFDTEPVVTSWGSDRLDILCLGKGTSAVWHQAWNKTSWEPSVETWDFDAGSFKKFP